MCTHILQLFPPTNQYFLFSYYLQRWSNIFVHMDVLQPFFIWKRLCSSWTSRHAHVRNNFGTCWRQRFEIWLPLLYINVWTNLLLCFRKYLQKSVGLIPNYIDKSLAPHPKCPNNEAKILEVVSHPELICLPVPITNTHTHKSATVCANIYSCGHGCLLN